MQMTKKCIFSSSLSIPFWLCFTLLSTSRTWTNWRRWRFKKNLKLFPLFTNVRPNLWIFVSAFGCSANYSTSGGKPEGVTFAICNQASQGEPLHIVLEFIQNTFFRWPKWVLTCSVLLVQLMVKGRARFWIKIVQVANIINLELQAIGEEQKKKEGDNEEVSGVPEQVDWSIPDNVFICGWIVWIYVWYPVSVSLCALTFQDVVSHLSPSCQMCSSQFWNSGMMFTYM